MGKSTISMAILNSYVRHVSLPEGMFYRTPLMKYGNGYLWNNKLMASLEKCQESLQPLVKAGNGRPGGPLFQAGKLL